MLRLAHLPRFSGALAVMLSVAPAATANAVVINAWNDAPNLIAPGDDPGWDNVGRVAGASAVYLGNRWVITANHVSKAPLRLSDGRVFDVSVGSDVRIKNSSNPFSSSGVDLRMFRLAEDPGLPSLQIASSSPTRGATVTMIGVGFDRAPELIGWGVNRFGQWTQIQTPLASQFGYSLLETSHMRWGMNQVSSDGSKLAPASNTYVFSTHFDRPGLPFEAQAVVGDSGGGVFKRVGEGWELVGIMSTVQSLSGQPAWTVVYGSATNSADLSKYRDQILDLIDRPEPLWQNQVNYFDVDRSGRVNAHDALVVINELQERAGANLDLNGAPGPSDPFFDVNGDRRVTPQDVSRLINALFDGSAQATSGLQPSAAFVPEPSSLWLAAVAAAWVVFWIPRRIARRRRSS